MVHPLGSLAEKSGRVSRSPRDEGGSSTNTGVSGVLTEQLQPITVGSFAASSDPVSRIGLPSSDRWITLRVSRSRQPGDPTNLCFSSRWKSDPDDEPSPPWRGAWLTARRAGIAPKFASGRLRCHHHCKRILCGVNQSCYRGSFLRNEPERIRFAREFNA